MFLDTVVQMLTLIIWSYCRPTRYYSNVTTTTCELTDLTRPNSTLPYLHPACRLWFIVCLNEWRHSDSRWCCVMLCVTSLKPTHRATRSRLRHGHTYIAFSLTDLSLLQEANFCSDCFCAQASASCLKNVAIKIDSFSSLYTFDYYAAMKFITAVISVYYIRWQYIILHNCCTC